MPLFGSPSDKYPPDLHPVSEYDIKQLVTEEHAHTLNQAQVEQVRSAITSSRQDGRISLRKIYELLEHMVLRYEISKFDRDAVLSLFQNYFTKHFSGH